MNKVIVNADLGFAAINENIYGHFSEHLGRCIYGGYWVGENAAIANTRGIRDDVVKALKQLNPPVLRWPGGCFADEYHWKDGVGPKSERPTMINTHWGGVTENNHFGTHEFMDLCHMLGTAPYICGNVGSGTVREMAQWIEYMTFDGTSPMADWRRANGRDRPWRLPFFGVGNENWGCGGHMRPEYYADLYRQFQTYVRNYSGNTLYKIACGPNGSDYRWTEVLMREAGRLMDGLSLHYYTVPGDWHRKGSATGFNEDEWLETMVKASYIDELITRHSAIMDCYNPHRRVGLIVDEWGTWYDVEPGTNPGFLYQQNTMRDALVAAIHLNVFNNHATRVHMANIAQTVNVLQAVILTDDHDIVLTPTYHVFEMYKMHHGATALPFDLMCDTLSFQDREINALSVSASRSERDTITLSIGNLHPVDAVPFEVVLRGFRASGVKGRVLTGSAIDSHNTFDNPEEVSPQPYDDIVLGENGFHLELPPRSVTVVEISS